MDFLSKCIPLDSQAITRDELMPRLMKICTIGSVYLPIVCLKAKYNKTVNY